MFKKQFVETLIVVFFVYGSVAEPGEERNEKLQSNKDVSVQSTSVVGNSRGIILPQIDTSFFLGGGQNSGSKPARRPKPPSPQFPPFPGGFPGPHPQFPPYYGYPPWFNPHHHHHHHERPTTDEPGEDGEDATEAPTRPPHHHHHHHLPPYAFWYAPYQWPYSPYTPYYPPWYRYKNDEANEDQEKPERKCRKVIPFGIVCV